MAFYCAGGYTSDDNFDDKNVVKARDRKSGEFVAIKRWRKGHEEALAEIDAWQRAYPELFVKAREDGDFVFLVHKWIEGVVLSDYAMGDGEDALQMMKSVAEALSDFHNRLSAPMGDLKPENIIVGASGVKLIDFESCGLKHAGEAVGGRKTLQFASRAFTAPEVYHGDLMLQSDVYSLGILYLFAKSGNVSFEALDEMEEDEKEFVLKCTAKNPMKRFENGGAALTEINKMIETRKPESKSSANREIECEFETGFEKGTNTKAESEKTGEKSGTEIDERIDEEKEDYENETRKTLIADEIRVENMTVNAKNFNYGAKGSFVAEPRSKAQENYGREKDVNSREKENKIRVFPTRQASYRRLVIYVPGNISFAAELAFLMSSMYEMHTVLFDLNDYDLNQVKYHIPTQVADAKPERKECVPDMWKEKGYIKACTVCEKLDVAVGETLAAGEMAMHGIRDIAVWCYSNYDIAVFSDATRLNAEMSVELMRCSDYVVVPISGDVDVIEAQTLFYRHYFSEMKIPLAKLRFVAWEYSEKRSVDHEAMVLTLGEEAYAGTISYDSRRHSAGNQNGSMYCESISPKIKSQYSDLIGTLLFGKTKSA